MRDLFEMSLAAGFWLVAIWLFVAVSPSYGATVCDANGNCHSTTAGPGCFVESGETQCSERFIDDCFDGHSKSYLQDKYGKTIADLCDDAQSLMSESEYFFGEWADCKDSLEGVVEDEELFALRSQVKRLRRAERRKARACRGRR